MLGNKIFVTLVAMFVMLAALFSTEISHFSEGYMHGSGYCSGGRPQDKSAFAAWGGAGIQTTNVGTTAVSRGGQRICNANTKLGYQTSECGSEFPRGVSSKRTMQSTISPRFNSVGTNPAIRYSQAASDVGTAALDALHPITTVDRVQAAADLVQPSPKAPVKTVEKYEYENAHVPLPTDMCNINLMGTETQPVIYDRLMYSNMRSRLRGQGDYIRGDLLITPDNYKAGCQHNNWFQVSVKPERDLNPGAMEHLYGKSEELSLSVGQGDLCVPTYGV